MLGSAIFSLPIYNLIGKFFFQAFGWLALYLPLYLASIGFYLQKKIDNTFYLIFINLTFFPFITLVLLLRFLHNYATTEWEITLFWHISQNNRTHFIMFFITILLLELTLISYFWYQARIYTRSKNHIFSSTAHTNSVNNGTENSVKKDSFNKENSIFPKHTEYNNIPRVNNAKRKIMIQIASRLKSSKNLFQNIINKINTILVRIESNHEDKQKEIRNLLNTIDSEKKEKHTANIPTYEDEKTIHYLKKDPKIQEIFEDPIMEDWHKNSSTETLRPHNHALSSSEVSPQTSKEKTVVSLSTKNVNDVINEHLGDGLKNYTFNSKKPDTEPALHPHRLKRPEINVEQEFIHHKKNWNEELLPPHLRESFFTQEEQDALHSISEEIIENTQIEHQISELIDEASTTLDKIIHNSPQQRKDDSDYSKNYEEKKHSDAQVYQTSNIPRQTLTTNETLPDHVESTLDSIHFSNIPSSVYPTSSPTITTTDNRYQLPKASLLHGYESTPYWEIDEETKQLSIILENTLKEFKIEGKVTNISKGSTITMFELLPASGVKLSRIEGLADNIAFRLAAKSVRIVAPIPGKQAVGVEIPNKIRSIVSFQELIDNSKMIDNQEVIPVILGKDIAGDNQIIDLTKTPHLLIAGATGSGKSVCVNGLISSILFTKKPSEVRMILIDPKVVELKPFNDVPHLLTPVITNPKRALQAIQWVSEEMDRRYTLLDNLGVRNISSYNHKIKEMNFINSPLPYLVVVIDEFADLMATGAKELEGLIARLAAKSRASGIHLVLATQRPSVDVITGLIKANFPSRVAFMVAGKMDSRVILDTNGAEQLLGKGDMLFISSWSPVPVRIQGAFLSDEEVESIAEFVKSQGKPNYIDDEIFYDDDDASFSSTNETEDDILFDQALEVVLSSGKASASYLQRRFKIGYNRAARLIEIMESKGIVGPANGSKPREILQ